MSTALSLLRFVTIAGLCALAACAGIAGIDADSPSSGSSSGTTNPAESGNVGQLVVTPLELAIPELRCSADHQTSKITLRNDSDTSIDWEVALPLDSIFSFDGGASTTSGQLAPKASKDVVFAIDVSRPGTVTGEILITTGDGVVQVKASTVVKGAELTTTPSIIDFGEVRRGTDVAPENVALANTGNEAITVTGYDGLTAEFTVPPDPVTIAPNETANIPITFVKGKEGPPLSAEVTPKTEAVLCGKLPKLLLKGTRVNRDVLVNPLTASFGEIDCNSQPSATRQVVLSNYGNTPLSVTVGLASDSWFTVSPNGTFVIGAAPGGGNPTNLPITFGVKPLGGAIGDHAETITVTVASNPPVSSAINANLKVVGGVLEVSPDFLDVGSQSKEFKVVNRGNKYIKVRHSSSEDEFSVESNYGLYPNYYATPRVSLSTNRSGEHRATVDTTRGDSEWWEPTSGRLCNQTTSVQVKGQRNGGSSSW